MGSKPQPAESAAEGLDPQSMDFISIETLPFSATARSSSNNNGIFGVTDEVLLCRCKVSTTPSVMSVKILIVHVVQLVILFFDTLLEYSTPASEKALFSSSNVSFVFEASLRRAIQQVMFYLEGSRQLTKVEGK